MLADKPIGDWTDNQLRIGVELATAQRDQLASEGDDAAAAVISEVLCALVDERERRAYLYREMASALSYGVPSSVADLNDGWSQ